MASKLHQYGSVQLKLGLVFQLNKRDNLAVCQELARGKPERDIASDIRGLRGIIELCYGNSDLIALNEFIKKCSRF